MKKSRVWKKPKFYQPLLDILVNANGNPVYIKDIEENLGISVPTKRLSKCVWGIKYHAKGIVRSIKNKKTLLGYQLINFENFRK